jgi:hypothetical protein
MFNVNYLLVKAIQEDRLRDAKKNRLARLFAVRRSAAVRIYRRKQRVAGSHI